MTETLHILFICSDNSCRSQMAEGWAKALKRKQITPYSAGIRKIGVNPIAMRVMDEVSVDIMDAESNSVEDFKNQEFDFVITLSEEARENCPSFPGKTRYLHFPFNDPRERARSALTDEDKINVYRTVRDDIKTFIAIMPDNLF